jgi:hypothetical protein
MVFEAAMQNEKICMAPAWQIAYYGQPNIEIMCASADCRGRRAD